MTEAFTLKDYYGRVAEWFKAAVLKTVVVINYRGFNSHRAHQRVLLTFMEKPQAAAEMSLDRETVISKL